MKKKINIIIFYQDALSAENLIVRKSEIVDIENINPYISNLKDQKIIVKDMNEAIRENASKKMAFSVFCGDMVQIINNLRLLVCILLQKM